MRFFLSIFLFCFCISGICAQEKHFVFIQSDNNLPFYVSLKGKVYSSTASGYIILSKLLAGEYNCTVGFAQNAFPEQGFKFIIDNKDLGFNLKNPGEKGWELFNLQSLDVTMADTANLTETVKPVTQSAPKDDSEPLISFTKKKKVTPAKPKKTAESVVVEQPVTNEKPAGQEAKNEVDQTKESNTAALANVKKVSETNEEDGVHLSFLESNGQNIDTIQVIIPAVKTGANTEDNAATAENSSVIAPTKPAENTDKDSLKFLDMNLNNVAKDSAQPITNNENSSATTNSKCKNIATDEDFVRLRRKMAMQTSDEKMMNEARKLYRNKCLSTVQIKSLSTLFLSDEGRYNFFNTSYNSVSDAAQYPMLQSEFVDPAYVTRFKTMLQ